MAQATEAPSMLCTSSSDDAATLKRDLPGLDALGSAEAAVKFVHKVSDHVCGRPQSFVEDAVSAAGDETKRGTGLRVEMLVDAVALFLRWVHPESVDLRASSGDNSTSPLLSSPPLSLVTDRVNAGAAAATTTAAGTPPYTVESAKKDLVAAGVSGEVASAAAEAFIARAPAASGALARATSELSIGRLESFNWSVRVALSSDSVASLHDPVVWLLLVVRRPGGRQERVALELPRGEMASLVTALDEAHAAAQRVRV